MNRYILLLGSNKGDRSGSLSQARALIASAVGPVLAESPVLSTPPIGEGVTGEFLNQALLVESPDNPEELLDAVESIERSMGRDKPLHTAWNISGRMYSDRIIDIDIAFADMDGGMAFLGRWDSPRLCVPHRAVRERGFVRELVSALAPAPSATWSGTVDLLLPKK